MQKYGEECAQNGTSVTTREVLEDALDPAKGYCRGMGPGPKPLKKFKATPHHPEDISLTAEVETMKEKLSKLMI
jgi:hypothetical protein